MDILEYWTTKFPQMLESRRLTEVREGERDEGDGGDGADENPGEEAG